MTHCLKFRILSAVKPKVKDVPAYSKIMTLITLASTARRFRCCIICQTFARHFMTSQVTVSFIFPIIYCLYIFLMINVKKLKLSHFSEFTFSFRRTLRSKKIARMSIIKAVINTFFDSMKCYFAFEIVFFSISGSEIDECQSCLALLSFELFSTGRAHRANPAVSTTLIMHIKTTKKEVQIAATSAMI